MKFITFKNSDLMYPIEYFSCECGGRYDTTNKSKHMRTNKHKNWEKIEELKSENEKLKNLINNKNLIFCENNETLK
jgi:hypothetical protein